MLGFDNPYIAFLGLVLGFSFLIFVHELGHFAVAKFVGIKCTQFAIGFGNAICSYRKGIGVRAGSTETEYRKRILEHLAKRPGFVMPPADKSIDTKLEGQAAQELGLGETEYRLNTLPLGGYVKMLGQEDMDPAHRSDDPRSFNTKSVAARFWVLSAGVIMNLIFGAVFLAWAFMLGVNFPSARVGGVMPGSPAAQTYAENHDGDLNYLGIRIGDQVVSVNGKPAKDMMDLRIATALGQRGKEVAVVVRRAGVDEPLTYPIVPQASRIDGLLSAGIQPGATLQLAGVIQDSPIAKAGVKPDMVITAVNGQPVTHLGELMAVLNASAEPTATLSFTDPAGGPSIDVPVSLEAELTPNPDGPGHLLGLVPAAQVVFVDEKMPAARKGVQAGDVLAQVGGKLWPANVEEVAEQVLDADGKPLPLVVLRDGKLVDLGEIEARKGKLGVGVTAMLDQAVIGQVLPTSPAASGQPLPGGSRITAISGRQVTGWAQVQSLLMQIARDASAGQPTTLELTIQPMVGESEPEKLTIELGETELKQIAAATWLPPVEQLPLQSEFTLIKADGLVSAMGIGLNKTHQFMTQTYITLLRLFQGTVKPEHLRGPVGIIDEGTRIATRGFPYLLFFLGLISVNLAVINYLPIPIVDGGHIVFLVIEKIKGSPVSVKVQTWASIAGLALIGLVFLTTLWYDVGRLGLLSLLGG